MVGQQHPDSRAAQKVGETVRPKVRWGRCIGACWFPYSLDHDKL